MSIIDAHIHYGDDAPELLALLAEFDIRLHNICVAQDSQGAWRESAERYHSLAQTNPRRYAWCTSFDLPRLDDPGYVDDVLAGLERDFAAGAVACKVWKNIGMKVEMVTRKLREEGSDGQIVYGYKFRPVLAMAS